MTDVLERQLALIRTMLSEISGGQLSILDAATRVRGIADAMDGSFPHCVRSSVRQLGNDLESATFMFEPTEWPARALALLEQFDAALGDCLKIGLDPE
jgi:hypothetical protein